MNANLHEAISLSITGGLTSLLDVDSDVVQKARNNLFEASRQHLLTSITNSFGAPIENMGHDIIFACTIPYVDARREIFTHAEMRQIEMMKSKVVKYYVPRIIMANPAMDDALYVCQNASRRRR
jgi:hypothetical protein